MRCFLIAVAVALTGCTSAPRETTIEFDGIRSDALYRPGLSEKGDKTPAVVLIHSLGGWTDGTTHDLAISLNRAGIATLEMRYFKDHTTPIPATALASTLFGALRYLASREDILPNKIGIAGYSMGANLALMAASQKFTQQWGGGYQYVAHAPIYLPCWLNSQIFQGIRDIKGMGYVHLDRETFDSINKTSIRIFAAARDDYDNRDPGECANFVKYLNQRYEQNITLKTYPDATHGWNMLRSVSFYVPYACRGNGCINHMVRNESISNENIKDVTDYFVETLHR